MDSIGCLEAVSDQDTRRWVSASDEARRDAAHLKKAAESNDTAEVQRLTRKVYRFGIGEFQSAVIARHGMAFTIAHEIIEAMDAPKLELDRTLRFAFAKCVRLYLDLAFWNTFTGARSLRYELSHTHLFKFMDATPQDHILLSETTADKLREILDRHIEGLKEGQVGLKQELECARQSVKVIPAIHSKLNGAVAEGCGSAVKTILQAGVGAVQGSFTLAFNIYDVFINQAKLCRRLLDVAVAPWFAGVFRIHWLGMMLTRPAIGLGASSSEAVKLDPEEMKKSFQALEQLVHEKRTIRHAAICAANVYADLIWSNLPDSLRSDALQSLVKLGKRDPKVARFAPVRFFVAEHMGALTRHGETLIAKEASNFLRERRDKEGKGWIRELIAQFGHTYVCVWDAELHGLPPSPIRDLTSDYDEYRLEQLGVHIEDGPALIRYLTDHKDDLDTVDLRGVTNLGKDGAIKALNLLSDMRTLKLNSCSQVHIKGEGVVDALCKLTELSLTGAKVRRKEFEALLRECKNLKVLDLEGCTFDDSLKTVLTDHFSGNKLVLRGSRFKTPKDTETDLVSLLKKKNVTYLDLRNTDLSQDILKVDGADSLESLFTGPYGSKELGASDLEKCQGLTLLHLEGCKIPAKFDVPSIASLQKLSLVSCEGELADLLGGALGSLTELNAQASPITNDILASVAVAAPNLKALNLRQTHVTGRELGSQFTGFGNLTELAIGYGVSSQELTGSNADEQGALHWYNVTKKCPELRNLTLERHCLDARALTDLVSATLPRAASGGTPSKLTTIEIACRDSDSLELDEPLLKSLANCPKLRELSFPKGSQFTGTSLSLSNTGFGYNHAQLLLPYCPSLTSLYLKGCDKLTEKGLEETVNRCTHLNELDLSDCSNLSAEGGVDLKKLPPVTDAILESILRSCKSIPRLDFSDSKLAPSQIDRVIESKLGTAHTLVLSGHQLSEASLNALTSAAALEALTLHECPGVQLGHLKTFASLDNLRTLTIENSGGITRRSVVLNLRDSVSLRSGALKMILENVPNLCGLYLRASPELPIGQLQSALEPCVALHSLWLEGWNENSDRVDMELIASLVKRLPSLRQFSGPHQKVAEVVLAERTPPRLDPRVLPPYRQERVVTRSDLRTKLDDELRKEGFSTTLCIGGPKAGKTLGLLGYVHDFDTQNLFKPILWFSDADDHRRLNDQFYHLYSEICKERGTTPLESVERSALVSTVYGWLDKQSDKPHLIVFDGASRYSDLEPYVPTETERVQVLATMPRRPSFDRCSAVVLDELSAREARQLVQKCLKDPRYSDSDALRLAQRMGQLPLPLASACAVMKAHSLSCDAFLSDLTKPLLHREVFEEEQFLGERQAPCSVVKMWEPTLLQLSHPDLEALNGLAYVENLAIPRGLVEEMAESADLTRLSDHLLINECENSYSLNSLLQEVIRFKHAEWKEEDKTSFFCRMAQIFLKDKFANSNSLDIHREKLIDWIQLKFWRKPVALREYYISLCSGQEKRMVERGYSYLSEGQVAHKAEWYTEAEDAYGNAAGCFETASKALEKRKPKVRFQGIEGAERLCFLGTALQLQGEVLELLGREGEALDCYDRSLVQFNKMTSIYDEQPAINEHMTCPHPDLPRYSDCFRRAGVAAELMAILTDDWEAAELLHLRRYTILSRYYAEHSQFLDCLYRLFCVAGKADKSDRKGVWLAQGITFVDEHRVVPKTTCPNWRELWTECQRRGIHVELV